MIIEIQLDNFESKRKRKYKIEVNFKPPINLLLNSHSRSLLGIKTNMYGMQAKFN
jgi:hypothetical protein